MRSLKMVVSAVLILMACSAATAGGFRDALEDFSGDSSAQRDQCLVVAVHDGDTFSCRYANTQQSFQVRLANIDAPEITQTYGVASREMLKAMVYKKMIVLERTGGSSYDRVIAVVRRNDVIVNRVMVRNGGAWVYTQYLNDPKMPALERFARQHRVGLWVDANPVAPWDYRHNQQPQNVVRHRSGGMTSLLGAKGWIHNYLHPNSRAAQQEGRY